MPWNDRLLFRRVTALASKASPPAPGWGAALLEERSTRTEWIVIAVLVALSLGAVAIFNRLVRQRNLVREGWSGIDVQLKRRSDLIPNLVETVKAYAAHEHGVFEDVAARRAASAGAAAVPAKAEAERPRSLRSRGALERQTELAASAQRAIPRQAVHE